MFSVLEPAGAIAAQESALMVHATLLMLIVVVPVLGLLFFFAWRYRAGNKARYEPEWEHSRMDELIWWAIPLEIVLVLAAITWTSTHALDPRKPLVSTEPAITVQVVALPWKWLFIYPAQGIATVNVVEVPAGTPVNFEITADAPMNSFWIPRLGGQIYAMTGMVNALQLIAAEPGDYAGVSANYSGEGFADMRFMLHAVPQSEFDVWVADTRNASTTFDLTEYQRLAAPGTTTPAYFASVESGLFDAILSKFEDPSSPGHHH